MGDLNDKQKKFVEEYLVDFNATQAAIRSGYSPKTAYRIGFENLRKPQIQVALGERAEQLALEVDVTPEKVIKELTMIAFSDIRNMIEWDGERVVFKPSDELSDNVAHAISEVSAEVSTTMLPRINEEGELVRDVELQVNKMKLKTWDKMKALEKLGQYFKLFTENLNLSGNLTLEALSQKSDAELDDLIGGGE